MNSFMNRAFIFPGQGSQVVGMGKDFYDAFKEAKEVFDEVDDALGYKLSDVIFHGPEEELNLTEHTQSALMAVSMAMLAVIRGNKTGGELCSYVAGHSLGEYSALCAAESLTLRDTARLLKIRGKSMQDAAPVGIGAMAACIGIGIGELEGLINKVKGKYVCEIANDNIIGQIVISGHSQAIDAVISEMQTMKYKAIKLKVSAPFHSALIKPAEFAMQDALDTVVINKPKVPVIANVSAREESGPATIKQNLVTQICGRVRWRESLDRLQELGVEEIVEIGSGKILSNMIKKAGYPFVVKNVGNIGDL
jgi:[acyl-carrier-protein] S-malonyltransferase